MRKWRNDFQHPSSYDPYYDLFDDWDLIESSFAQQYGIRLRKNISEMEWGEFSSLLAGINGETALGNIVRIRSEKDPEALKKFSPEEKRIRNEWLKKSASHITEEDYEQAMENFKAMFKNMAEKGR